MVTVTRAALSEDRKRGTIFITVYPTADEEAAIKFANRNRREFTDFFIKRVRGMSVPHVEFVIDEGEKSRQRLDELTK